ncbi:glycerophosphodiester phosphodiesterase [Microlunatus sp. GCM10028923]|uniref:glycerophosphodiester phosphodiesterase n=1 Tax=Microlunatus sp. GCM10028923 TaxID=3273400 RepID=UPI003616D81D
MPALLPVTRPRISRAIVLARAVAIMVLAGVAMTAYNLPARADRSADVDVIAHRGASGVAPENTAPAIRAAIIQRADFVEIDVQRTKDGKLVNFHDCTLVRTTDVEERFPGRTDYRVSDFTLAELKTLDAGSWFGPRFAGEKILTFGEVIGMVRNRTGLLAEISPCAHYLDTGLPEQVAAELEATPRFLDRALAEGALAVQSFSVADGKAFHARLPEVPVGLLHASRPTEAELVELSTWADQINPSFDDTDPALIERAHQLGLAINVWTVNDASRMRELIALGVDGIITDYPQSLTGPSRPGSAD